MTAILAILCPALVAIAWWEHCRAERLQRQLDLQASVRRTCERDLIDRNHRLASRVVSLRNHR